MFRVTSPLRLETTSDLVAKVQHGQLLQLVGDQSQRLRERATCTFKRMTRSLAINSLATWTFM